MTSCIQVSKDVDSNSKKNVVDKAPESPQLNDVQTQREEKQSVRKLPPEILSQVLSFGASVRKPEGKSASQTTVQCNGDVVGVTGA